MLKAVASAAGDPAADITIGSSVITGGTDTRVLFDDNAVVGEDAGLVFNKTTDALTVVGTVTGGGFSTGGTTAGVNATYSGSMTTRNALATPAAASAVGGLLMGSALVGIYWGTGSPSAALTAPKGSLYLRTDGSSSSTRAYINTDGSTAWTNITTAG